MATRGKPRGMDCRRPHRGTVASWCSQVTRLARKLALDVRGAMAILYALTLPVMIAAMGGAIDYGYAYMQKSQLQQTSDAAVIAAARELHLARTDSEVAKWNLNPRRGFQATLLPVSAYGT